MAVCHGRGDPEHDGCCYVEGEVCPLRWKAWRGHIYAGPEMKNLGTIAEAVDTLMPGHSPQERAEAIRHGVGQRTIICSAALRYAGDWTAVHTDPEYNDKVRPAWERLEQDNGWEPGAYQCGTWGETFGRGQCCFGEDPETNARKAAWMTEVPVEIGRR